MYLFQKPFYFFDNLKVIGINNFWDKIEKNIKREL